MKRIFLPVISALIIAGLLLVIGYLWKENKKGPLVTEQAQVSAHTILKEVLPIGEYASLAYHYTSVVKNVSNKDIKGWNIPFTTSKYIFTYDGVMKLGIDCGSIKIEEGPDAENAPIIKIILPPIRILSHEIIDNSVEVFEQSQTIFNEIKIDEAFKVTAERKKEMEEKIMAEGGVSGRGVIDEAKNSLEQQFGSFLRGLPGIAGTRTIEFVWEAEQEKPR